MTESVYGALQVDLGAVFFVAAVMKLRRPRAFIRVVLDQGVIPVRLASFASIPLILIELLTGLSLLSGSLAQVGVAVATSLVAVFSVITGINLARNRIVPCGCFGGDEVISRRSLIRLGLLFGCGLTLLALHSAGASPMTIASVMHRGTARGSYLAEIAILSTLFSLVGFWILNISEVIVSLRGLGAMSGAVNDHRLSESPPIATVDDARRFNR